MDAAPAPEFSKAYRWTLLLIVSVVIAANYYAYDALSGIKEVLTKELGISSGEYGLIVSFYSFPNTFLLMGVLGGILLDRWGIRRTGLLFNLLCALGVLLTAYAASGTFRTGGGPLRTALASFLPAYSPELKLMILGRLLFGLGAETSIVVINKIVAKWFQGRELAFAFSVNLAIARLGTAAALILSPQLIAAPTGWTTALWAAALMMGTGLAFFLVYMAWDRKAETGLVGSSPEEAFRLSDITDLLRNGPFLLICALCVTFYSAVFPFQAFCPDLLRNKFGLSLEMSGAVTSVITWGTIVFTPLFGLLVDRKGLRGRLMVLGSGMLMASHLILALTHVTPYVAMFVLGIAFSLVPAALWPSVPLLVNERRLGTAYGLMTSIQNLGLWGFPILAGTITDRANPGVTPEMVAAGAASLDYTWTVLMFAGLGLVGFAFAIGLRLAAPHLERAHGAPAPGGGS